MSIRVTRTVQITLPGTTIQNGELIDRLSEMDRAAEVNITVFKADSRDPREHDYVTLTVRTTS